MISSIFFVVVCTLDGLIKKKFTHRVIHIWPSLITKDRTFSQSSRKSYYSSAGLLETDADKLLLSQIGNNDFSAPGGTNGLVIRSLD